jgi:hypothetical protein
VSDTPETDAAWIESGRMDSVESECFLRNLATKLERDLSAAKALMIEMIAQKNVELWQLRKQRDGLREALEDLVKINKEHNEAVKKVMGRPLNWKDSYLDKARAALASVKEGQS